MTIKLNDRVMYKSWQGRYIDMGVVEKLTKTTFKCNLNNNTFSLSTMRVLGAKEYPTDYYGELKYTDLDKIYLYNEKCFKEQKARDAEKILRAVSNIEHFDKTSEKLINDLKVYLEGIISNV